MESLNLDSVGEIVAYLSIYDVTCLSSTSKYFNTITWPAVKRLDLEFNEEILIYILSRNLTSINHISLKDPKYKPDEIRAQVLTNLTTLKSIDINSEKRSNTAELLRICICLTQLESIKCRGNMEGADLASFSLHRNLTTFTWRLDASIPNKWGDLTKLRKLKLWCNIDCRCDIRMLSNLTSLDIAHSILNSGDEHHLTCLTSLREVRSKNNNLSRDILTKLPKLSSIDLSEVKNPNIDAIATQLTKLKFAADLNGAKFPKSGLLTNLKHLVIEGHTRKLPDNNNFHFTDLKQLRKIEIRSSSLIPGIAAADLTNLRELAVLKPSITHITKEEIISMCNIPSLKKLVVSLNELDTDTFFQHVSNLSNLQSLTIASYLYLKPDFPLFLRPLTCLTYLHMYTFPADAGQYLTVLTQLIELNAVVIQLSAWDTTISLPFVFTMCTSNSNYK